MGTGRKGVPAEETSGTIMRERTTAYWFWLGIYITAGVGFVTGLLTYTGAKPWAVVLMAILGALAFSKSAAELGLLKAPIAIGTPVRAIIILGLIWIGMGFLGYAVFPAPTPAALSNPPHLSAELVFDQEDNGLLTYRLLLENRGSTAVTNLLSFMNLDGATATNMNRELTGIAPDGGRGELLDIVPYDAQRKPQSLVVDLTYRVSLDGKEQQRCTHFDFKLFGSSSASHPYYPINSKESEGSCQYASNYVYTLRSFQDKHGLLTFPQFPEKNNAGIPEFVRLQTPNRTFSIDAASRKVQFRAIYPDKTLTSEQYFSLPINSLHVIALYWDDQKETVFLSVDGQGLKD